MYWFPMEPSHQTKKAFTLRLDNDLVEKADAIRAKLERVLRVTLTRNEFYTYVMQRLANGEMKLPALREGK